MLWRIIRGMTSTLDAVEAAAKVYRRHDAAARRARAELHAAIRTAAAAKDPQVLIADRSGYKREQVRRIVAASRPSES